MTKPHPWRTFNRSFAKADAATLSADEVRKIEVPSRRIGKTAAGKIGNRNAKRGRALEDVVGPMLRRVPDSDIQKTTAPTRILRTIPPGAFKGTRFEVVFEQKGFCDYSGWFRGVHAEIEAKRFADSGQTWNFKAAIKPHQVDRMERCRAAGGLSGVVLLVDDGDRLFGIPWETIAGAIARGRKSFTVPDLEQAAAACVVDALPGVFYPVIDLRTEGATAFLATLFERRIRK